ncbi:glutamyl aminopeptidase [Streptococcaceae bacterium ESL0729]|nr:glutamyl aminopeptidase [Streptococcaceae bacterium ESL0729]
MELFNKIKTLTELQAAPGFEGPVRDYLKQEITPLVDRVEFDGLGGIFGIRENEDANAPKIMVAAHMDEVAFMVSRIEENGTFRVVPLGGWNPLVVSGQRFTLFTKDGRKIPVVSGGVPPHLLRGAAGPKIPQIGDIIFDGGFTNKKEAVAYGVKPGQPVVPESQTILTANKKNVISKSWDNRYGCLMVTELLSALKDEKLPNTLIAGANVQEEVGLRGAQVSTTKFNPDLFFAVDCSPAQDTFDKTADGRLGQGTLLRIFDPGHIMLPNMQEFLLDTARDAGIKMQYYVSKGGTDAGAAHLKGDGIPSTTIGVCARYIHSHQTIFNLDDFAQAQAYLQAIVKNLDKTTVDTIKNY